MGDFICMYDTALPYIIKSYCFIASRRGGRVIAQLYRPPKLSICINIYIHIEYRKYMYTACTYIHMSYTFCV